MVHACVSSCHLSAGARGPPASESQGVVNHQMWVLALNPGPLEEEYVPLTAEPSPAPGLPTLL